MSVQALIARARHAARHGTVALLIFTLIAAGCSGRAPLYLTPTPAPLERITPSTGEPDGMQMGARAVQTPEIESQGRIKPTVTWVGPVIGPGYTIPATLPPTTPTADAATAAPTATPAAPVTGQPTVTGTPLFPETLPDLDRARIGMQFDLNIEQSDWDEAMFRMNEHIPVGWVKFQIPWRDVAPNAAGELSEYWQRTRLYLEDADRRGFRILLSIVKAPLWARSVQAEDGPPDDPAQYAAFLTQILGEVGGTIDAIEIWNEPNLRREWQGTLPFDGAGYMRLFVAGYSAIRAYSPSIIIVSAGLAPTSDGGFSRDDRSFLREMYAAGLGNYRDIAVGAHPYSWANPPDATCCGTQGWDDDPHFFFADNVRDYRQIMVDNGHSDVQMWITEFGYATWQGLPDRPRGEGNEWVLRNDQWDQANYTISTVAYTQSQPWMGPLFIWNLNFAVLPGLIENLDERVAYSLVIPGSAGDLILGIDNRTERPLYWMIHDAIRTDIELDQYD